MRVLSRESKCQDCTRQPPHQLHLGIFTNCASLPSSISATKRLKWLRTSQPRRSVSKPLKTDRMADVADCSPRSVNAIRSNLRCFGTTRAPFNGGGRPRSTTPSMLNALREYLLEMSDLYLDEMAVFLWDGFEVLATKSSISRALSSIGWLKKAARRVVKE